MRVVPKELDVNTQLCRTDSPVGGIVLTRIIQNRKLFIFVFAFSLAVTGLIVFTIPPKYESRMKLLVRSDRQSLVIDPNEGKTSSTVQDLVENRVNSEIALMTSRDVLQQVVLQSDLAHEPGTVAAAGPPTPVGLNSAINTLGRQLDIEPVKRSAVISVTYKARSPELATAVMKNLADTYLNMHLRAHAKPGSFKFFDEQADTFEGRLTSSEDQLKSFRRQHSFGDPEQKEALTQKALEAQAALDETNVQLADCAGRISSAIRKIDELQPRITSQVRTTPQSALIAQLNNTLAELQNKRTETLTKFRADDRMVKQLDDEIADTKATLDRMTTQPNVETTTDINQIRQDAQKDLVAQEVAFKGLKERQGILKKNVDAYKGLLAEVATASTQNDELTRAVKENEDKYLLYSKEREEARIADSLDQQRITDVSVIESPTFEVQPVSPVVKLDLVIGFALSLMLAYLAVTVWDLTYRRPVVADSGQPYAITAA
jgi:uncharacterized protein involved in exopolysaccharide biosynthesis